MLDPHMIYEQHTVSCVDINGSEKLIDAGEDGLTGQFFKDLLNGGIQAVERRNGSVINFTGDGFIAVLLTETDAAHACWEIARDLRKTREYLKDCLTDCPESWPQLDIGVGLKIAIEGGQLEVSSISSAFLGVQPFLVVPPTCLCFEDFSICQGGPLCHRPERRSQLAVPWSGRPLRR